jgi:hypothetical protein
MSTIHRFRSMFLGSAAFLALALFAPGVVNADDAIPLVAPVAAPSTDAEPVMAPVAGPSVGGTSADDVRAALALAAQGALQSGEMGSLQEDRLLAIVAAAPGWDETSGYRSVEASRAAASALLAPVAAPSWDEISGYRSVETSRATIGHLAASTSASTTQVPADVRWAPVRAIAPESSVEGSRVRTAQQALRSPDLGSLQEEALLAVVGTGSSWDQTSGYASVEASRVTIGHSGAPAIGGTMPDYLATALASGQRTESAHLAAVSLPGEAVSVNPSDDWIAAALSGDELSG